MKKENPSYQQSLGDLSLHSKLKQWYISTKRQSLANCEVDKI